MRTVSRDGVVADVTWCNDAPNVRGGIGQFEVRIPGAILAGHLTPNEALEHFALDEVEAAFLEAGRTPTWF
jgi:hypothetical protein